MNLTPYQLAEAFPNECKEFIPIVLPALKSKLLQYREKLKLIEKMPINDKTKALYFMFVDYNKPKETKMRIETYEKTMYILKNIEDKKFLDNKRAIELAKIKPIETLYGFEKIKSSGNRLFAICPFHSEKTGSFVIYKDSNTYHCFGACGSGGDSISFIMKLNGVDFKTAIRMLSL